jgi:hypothetical protein
MGHEETEIASKDLVIMSEYSCHEHINIVVHYSSFDLAYEILKGKLRSLLPMDEKLFGEI